MGLVFLISAQTCSVDFQALETLEEVVISIHLVVVSHLKEQTIYLNNSSEAKIRLLVFLMMIRLWVSCQFYILLLGKKKTKGSGGRTH